MNEGLLDAATGLLPLMVDRLGELVRCESPSAVPENLELCAELIRPWLEAAVGRPVELIRVQGTTHVVAPAPNPRVLLLGHYDTVWPIGTITDWPFTIQGGIASGPGVFDMKGGIVQALGAISLSRDPDHVSVVLTGDEEIGSVSSRALIREEARRCGAVLVCEPAADGGAVKTARKGIATYTVAIHGRAAHAGLEPHLGVNSSVELAHQIMRITALNEGDTTVTPTLASAGTTQNSVPETARVYVDARAWTIAALERVDTAMAGLVPHLPGAQVTISGGIERPPLEEPQARALYAQAAAVAVELGLAPLSAARSGGGSDGNITAALGIPTLDGLGAVGGHPHARDEHVWVAAMPERAALLAALLQRLKTFTPTDDR
ncbi:M20 family metallopeptidase [Nocardia sp. CNY236]|uniref:M20 family metallopeptidase n=1 Tax=Nocardia sp. CNY236 TaxID=1169152 RepID=UPI000416AEE8|nr:M20 family metallopeptidase [Nocardia sp. CNY236]